MKTVKRSNQRNEYIYKSQVRNATAIPEHSVISKKRTNNNFTATVLHSYTIWCSIDGRNTVGWVSFFSIRVPPWFWASQCLSFFSWSCFWFIPLILCSACFHSLSSCFWWSPRRLLWYWLNSFRLIQDLPFVLLVKWYGFIAFQRLEEFCKDESNKISQSKICATFPNHLSF